MGSLERLKELLRGQATQTRFEKFETHLKTVRRAIAVSPFVGMALPWLHFLWPPVSDLTNYAGVPASALIGLAGWIPSQIPLRAAKKWMAAGFGIAVLSLASYVYLFAAHIYCTEWGRQQCFTIGSCVDPNHCPRSVDDYTKEFQQAGPGGLEACFTARSVHTAEVELFLSIFLCLTSTNFAVGCLARLTAPSIGRAEQTGQCDARAAAAGNSEEQPRT
jgi:hypothetical protein